MEEKNEVVELLRKQEKRAKEWDNAVTATGCVFVIPFLILAILFIILIW